MNNQREESEKNIRVQSKETLNNKFIYESFLYKITPNTKKLKKLYFKLYDKNLYYYKNENSPIHKGMHNLCHYFLELTEDNDNESDSNKKLVDKNNTSHSQEEEEDESFLETEKSNPDKIIIKTINSVDYYCFVLISQKGKVQWYLTPEIDIYNKWVELLKELMNYKDISNEYEFKEVTGKGKFSVVYCAYDKKNKRKVAIKRIDKTLLKMPELELIKTEIDILKICQHPYVIGLYDIIETYNTMDIILEYCQIGNLFNYLSKKNFNLTEQQIVTYIHKISKAVYSMHNLGIIHRDLKLSNIAMANEKEGDIRILDFGLSEIIGPGEYCSESYGTPGYASPEVINEEEYGFKADVWSIGAIAYIMCTSKLPFDYPTKGLNKANIILNTLNDELKFNEDCWKKYSKEAVNFIKACMNKNTEKRLNIKQVLEHEWIKKYFYMEVKNRESSNNYEIEKKKICQKIDTSPYRLYAAISSEI
jgi:tRNA A-37 threonylcarbamoyl transferase component Bud32